MVGFGTLALAWLLTAALAFARARQQRFDEHRAWMMRSYSLTFAAATARLAGLPILVLTRAPNRRHYLHVLELDSEPCGR
jgi:Predicted membrane protein (DUF2306)